MSEEKEIKKARRKKIPSRRRVSGLEVLEGDSAQIMGRREPPAGHPPPKKLSQ
jgi:hypothetical protein